MSKIFFILFLLNNFIAAMEIAQKPTAMVVGHGPISPATRNSIKRVAPVNNLDNKRVKKVDGLELLFLAAKKNEEIALRASKQIARLDQAELLNNLHK